MPKRDMSRVKEALYNTHPASGPQITQPRGIVIGVVACLMSERGIDFDSAVKIVKGLLPEGYDIRRIPYAWQDDFQGGQDD